MDQTTAITIVSRDDRRAAELFKMTLPYGNLLSDANALALALYSRAHGLNPANGECYYLVRINNGQREEKGVYPGIKAYRKKAKEQLRQQDPQANYHIEYDEVNPAETKVPDINTIALCVRATLRDDVSTGHYILDVFKLSKSGFSKDEITAMIGQPPVWIGYGIVKKSELGYIKMSPMSLAKKRAEADATKQRFDLPFEEMAEEVAPEIVPDMDNSHAPIITVSKTSNQLIGELGFSDHEPPREMIEETEKPQETHTNGNGNPPAPEPKPAPARKLGFTDPTLKPATYTREDATKESETQPEPQEESEEVDEMEQLIRKAESMTSSITGEKFGTMSDATLRKITLSASTNQAKKDAAALILQYRAMGRPVMQGD